MSGEDEIQPLPDPLPRSEWDFEGLPDLEAHAVRYLFYEYFRESEILTDYVLRWRKWYFEVYVRYAMQEERERALNDDEIIDIFNHQQFSVIHWLAKYCEFSFPQESCFELAKSKNKLETFNHGFEGEFSIAVYHRLKTMLFTESGQPKVLFDFPDLISPTLARWIDPEIPKRSPIGKWETAHKIGINWGLKDEELLKGFEGLLKEFRPEEYQKPRSSLYRGIRDGVCFKQKPRTILKDLGVLRRIQHIEDFTWKKYVILYYPKNIDVDDVMRNLLRQKTLAEDVLAALEAS